MYVTPASRVSRARTGGRRQFGSRNFSLPQGRLTLTSNTPVMTTTASAFTTIRYTPYLGTLVPVWNGRSFDMLDIVSELNNVTTATAVGFAGPAAVTTNSNYDLFVWGNGILTRGPAWSSDTARGTGAGTTELVRVKGVLVNAYAITNGPPAQRGTYVGTVRSNGSSQIDFIFGASASGGTAGFFGVWNMYNRVNASSITQDSTASWAYSTASWRAADNSSAMRCSFILGVNEEPIVADYRCGMSTSSSGGQVGVGLDSTTALASGASSAWSGVSGATTSASALYAGYGGLGFHYASAIEYGGTGMTFYGVTGFPTSAFAVTVSL